MTSTAAHTVAVDTNVFGASLGTDPGGLVSRYNRHLSGARFINSFQTAAELRFGALNRNWGKRRRSQLEDRIRLAVVVPPHDDLTWEWARLRHECRKAGHALQAKHHSGDLWIGATARLAGVPLVTNDTIFDGTPGLTVIREP